MKMKRAHRKRYFTLPACFARPAFCFILVEIGLLEGEQRNFSMYAGRCSMYASRSSERVVQVTLRSSAVLTVDFLS